MVSRFANQPQAAQNPPAQHVESNPSSSRTISFKKLRFLKPSCTQKSNIHDNSKLYSVLTALSLMSLMMFAFLHIVTTSYIMTHVPRQTTIDGLDVSGESVSSIRKKLPNGTVEFAIKATTSSNDYQINSKDIMFYRNYDRVLDTINISLNTPLKAWRWWLLSITKPTTFQSPLFVDEQELEKVVSTIAKQELVEGVLPKVELKRTGDAKSLVVDSGKNGYQLKELVAKELILFALSQRDQNVSLPLQTTLVAQTPDEVSSLAKQAQSLVNRSLTFTIPDQPLTYKLNDVQLIELLTPDSQSITNLTDDALTPTNHSNTIGDEGAGKSVDTNQQLITQISQDWSKIIDRTPQNPALEIDPNSLKVIKFTPPLDGLVVNQLELQKLIASYINQVVDQAEKIQLAEVANDTKLLNTLNGDANQIASSYPLPLITQPPSLPLSKTNNLGINEKIGHGQSRYAGSIATRIHNVSLATSRVNLIILKPGQEFRFNDQLGDVSATTGFKPAYIIRSGKTELGDGGGVCQVSTTLFRAALDAGLQITKRRPHSYRVSYYELDTKPGIDATVFAGEVDLRFVNDTPGHILIYGQADPKSLTMYYDLYGTDDGRKASITDHVTWEATPPLPPEYIYDPSLAPGQRKQIDWSAPGLKAKFTYSVVDRFGNELQNQVFTSNYRPWSAKFLVGTPPESV